MLKTIFSEKAKNKFCESLDFPILENLENLKIKNSQIESKKSSKIYSKINEEKKRRSLSEDLKYSSLYLIKSLKMFSLTEKVFPFFLKYELYILI